MHVVAENPAHVRADAATAPTRRSCCFYAPHEPGGPEKI